MPLRDALLAMLVTVVWGTNFVVIHAGLADVPPFLLLAIRFVVVLVPAIFLVPRPKVPLRDLVVVGLLMSVGQFTLLYLALHAGMPAGLASLVLQVQVLLTVLAAAVALHERPGRRQLAAVGLGAVGLAVVGLGRATATPLVGVLLCVAAALSWALGNVAARRLALGAGLTGSSGLGLTVWSAIVVPLPVYLLSVLVEGPGALPDLVTHLTWRAVLSTAYTAYLASLLGYGIWNTLLARHPTAKVTPFALGVPVSGMLAGWFWLHEVPGALELAGGALVLAAVAIAVLPAPAVAAISDRFRPARQPN